MAKQILIAKLPWVDHRHALAEELSFGVGRRCLDFNAAFRRHLMSLPFVSRQLRHDSKAFAELDGANELAGRRILELYSIMRRIVLGEHVRSSSAAELAAAERERRTNWCDEYYYRLGEDDPSWYYSRRSAKFYFDRSVDEVLQPNRTARLMSAFVELLETPECQRVLADSRDNVVVPLSDVSQVPYCIVFAGHLRRANRDASLEILWLARPDPVSRRLLSNALGKQRARVREATPSGQPPPAPTSARLEVNRSASALQGRALRLIWEPLPSHLGSSAAALKRRVTTLRRRAPIHLVIRAAFAKGDVDQASYLFRMMDVLLEIQWDIHSFDIEIDVMDKDDSRSSSRKWSMLQRLGANLEDVFRLQLESELDNEELSPQRRRARATLMPQTVLQANCAIEMTSRYPLNELSAWQPQVDARHFRFGYRASDPDGGRVLPTGKQRYQLYAEAPTIFGSSLEDTSLRELIAAFSQPRSIKTIARRGYSHEALIECLETLVHVGVLENRGRR